MKRHHCCICKQKVSEEDLVKCIHVGKNGVAYHGWVCKNGTYARYSKNFNSWGHSSKYCESKLKERGLLDLNVHVDNVQDKVHIPGVQIIRAKFISGTGVAGVSKDRWECPNCRENKEPECRFNLSPKKRGGKHRCRFCKTELEIII